MWAGRYICRHRLFTNGVLRGCEFFVAEVVRLQYSPRKLNSDEFSYQFIHSLSVCRMFHQRSVRSMLGTPRFANTPHSLKCGWWGRDFFQHG